MADGSRRRASVRRLFFLVGGLAACAGSGSGALPPEVDGPATAPATAPATEAALAEAEYTEEQATRGERVFTTVCSVCHGPNEFRGPIFSMTWRVEPVGHLFQHIAATMPQDEPGSLSAEEYASIVAYFLRLNGRPPGDSELPSDPSLLEDLRW